VASPELLRKSRLFSRFDEETLGRLAASFTEVEIPENQVLIEARAPGTGLFVICDGTVVVEARGMQRELGSGEVVGEISLVEDDGTRRARVWAKTPVRCLVASRTDFEQMVTDVPELETAIRDLARERLAELGEGA
jgi:CRP-like cAMP-binding protein